MPVGMTLDGLLICLVVYGIACAIGYASERWRWGSGRSA